MITEICGIDAGGQHVAQEDVAVAAEAGDALLDARAAGVVDADDGRAGLEREVHDLRHLLAHRLGQRAAEDGEVLREDEDAAAVDLAVAGDDGVAEEVLLVHAELGRAVDHQLVELLERARVEEDVDALAGGQLAALVLRFDALQAAAEASLILHLEESFEPFFVRHRADRSKGRFLAAGYVCTIWPHGSSVRGRYTWAHGGAANARYARPPVRPARSRAIRRAHGCERRGCTPTRRLGSRRHFAAFVKQHFGENWASEADFAFGNGHPITGFVAIERGAHRRLRGVREQPPRLLRPDGRARGPAWQRRRRVAAVPLPREHARDGIRLRDHRRRRPGGVLHEGLRSAQ